MKRITGLIFLLCAAVAFSQGTTTWIRTARIFDGEAFQENRTIVVSGETIVRLADPSEAPPVGASVIDASDMTVTPGFVDAHSHFYGSPLSMERRPETYTGKMAEQGFSMAPENRQGMFEAGITTMLDMGSPLESYQGVRREIEKGTILCPELLYPGPLFTAPGGHPAGTIYKGIHFLIDQATVQTADPREAERRVDDLQAAGVSYIKIVYDGSQKVPRLSLEVAQAIIREAHRLGLRVFSHVTSPQEASDMLAAGVDGLEHAFKDVPSVVSQMAARGVIFTPTIQAFRTFLPGVVPGLVRDIKAAYDAGVPVAVGTDFPSGPGMRCGDDYFDELAFLEASGISRTQVLASATAVGALKAGEESAIGHIRPGYRANLVFFSGDLEKGAIVRDRIQRVMFHGQVVIEKGEVPDSMSRYFSARSLMAIPYGYYDALNSAVLGASVMDFDLFQTGILAGLTAEVSFKGQLSASLSAVLPSPIPRTFLSAALTFSDFSRMRYAVGNASALLDGTIDASPRLEESLDARAKIVGPLWLSPSLVLRQVWTPGHVGCLNETLGSLSLSLDWRDNPSNPWYGALFSATGDLSSALIGSSHEFQRLSFDARGYLYPFTHTTIAARILGMEAFGDTPDEYLPYFGGPEIGRGFQRSRFHDEILVASQIELRFPIYSILKGVAFVEAGEVAPTWSVLSLEGTHLCYGIGLRLLPSPDESTVLSLDAGFSNEGCSVWFRYGHAF